MSEMRQILEDTCAKLFARFEEPAMLRRVEAGEWPPEIWATIADAGLDQIFSGGSDDPWRDACVVLKACGRHILPAPLPETLMAGAMLADALMEPVGGPVTYVEEPSAAPPSFSTVLPNVAWGRVATRVVSSSHHELSVWSAADAKIARGENIAREPRDKLDFTGHSPLTIGSFSTPLPLTIGALARAAQTAGCIETVLAMTVQYARERKQFGKPIGSFQAIQHQLAILAGHSAAATRAVDAAFDRIAEANDDPTVLLTEAAVAKIRCGEAAGVAASIAHQTHGAIGFTDEHRLHYFTRRLWSWRSEFGSEAYWSGLLGRRVAAEGADGFWPMVTAAG